MNLPAKILGIHHIEFYVGNLFQADLFYRNVLGFNTIGELNQTSEAREKISHKDRKSFLLNQHNIYLILTAPMSPFSEIAEHVHQHGDGVKDIALLTDNTEALFQCALDAGAIAISEPELIEDNHCKLIMAKIGVFGDTCHSLIQRIDRSPYWIPKYNPIQKSSTNIRQPVQNLHIKSDIHLHAIDHVAVCLERGTLSMWRDFYEKLGLHLVHSENIYTGKSGMNSFALGSRLGDCTFTLVEPSEGHNKSQISEFLDFYGSAGVQHIAFSTQNIVQSVKWLNEKGISFLPIPAQYYQDLPARVRDIPIDISLLEQFQILVDRDQQGLLYQIFSKVIQTRPTFFIEVIQRSGALGFGSGNIKALFEAIEREQCVRETV